MQSEPGFTAWRFVSAQPESIVVVLIHSLLPPLDGNLGSTRRANYALKIGATIKELIFIVDLNGDLVSSRCNFDEKLACSIWAVDSGMKLGSSGINEIQLSDMTDPIGENSITPPAA
jgi:hypothetical protein